MGIFQFYKLIIFIISTMPITTKSQNISLDENRKLQGIVISIEPSVVQHDELIKSIKERFTDASKVLFEATGNMGKNEYAVQFGNVSIIIPKDWKLKENYDSTQYCDNAQIKIDKYTKNDEPFTRQLKGCGKSGDYIRFPLNFFKNNIQSESEGKKIMTEFVKLRYGVYSEQIIKNRVYTFNGTHYISSACNQNIEIVLPKNLNISECVEPNKVCHYSIKKNQNHNYSIMFDPSSKYFCNDADMPHNTFAKSLHNSKCKKASITSVILRHQDFKNIGNHKIQYEPPRFTILKTGNRKIVLVLDISASMAKVIEVMKEAVKIFIRDIVDDNDEIGLVTFHDKATILANLTEMNKTGRQLLINETSKIRWQGATNIGHGLELAIEVLGGNIKTPEKLPGMIILLSDGDNTYDPEDDGMGDNEENKPLSYEEVLEHVKNKSMMTNIVSYNQSDYLLIELSKATGGRFSHAPYDVTAQKLSQNFLNVQKVCPSGSSNSINTIKSEKIEVKTGKRIPFTNVDKYMGKNRTVEITVDEKQSKYEPILVDSNDKETLFESKSVSNKKHVYSFKLPNMFNGQLFIKFKRIARRYKRSINNLSVKPSKFRSLLEENEIIASPIDGLSETIIELLTENSRITATIDLSKYDLTEFQFINIILEIELPNKIIKRKLMLDDGIGDDSIEGDKIFTRCLFTNDLSIKGFYKLRGKFLMKNKFYSGIIRKFVDFQSIFVKDVDPSALKDRISPAQMKEPLIKIIDKQKPIIEVEMTAVGDNSMDGEIGKYQIRIRWLETKIINKNIKANSYEKVKILLDLSQLKISEKIVEISIRGVDDNGNTGQWSPNVAVLLSK